jgi:hypothetical protein
MAPCAMPIPWAYLRYLRPSDRIDPDDRHLRHRRPGPVADRGGDAAEAVQIATCLGVGLLNRASAGCSASCPVGRRLGAGLAVLQATARWPRPGPLPDRDALRSQRDGSTSPTRSTRPRGHRALLGDPRRHHHGARRRPSPSSAPPARARRPTNLLLRLSTLTCQVSSTRSTCARCPGRRLGGRPGAAADLSCSRQRSDK